VKLAVSGGKTIATTARDPGLKISTLHTRINKYRDEVELQPSTDLEARLIEQENEIKRLREERDILKRASAYFAANQK